MAGLFQGDKEKRHQAPDRDGGPGIEQGGTFDLELQDFLATHRNPETEYVIRLFRMKRIPGLPERNTYLQTWRGSVPEFDEVAAIYGPGKYRCNILYVDRAGTRKYSTRVFEIDPDWGGSRGELDAGRIRPVELSSGNGGETTLKMFEVMAGLVGQLSKVNGSNGNGSGLDVSGLSKAMAGLVMQSAKNQLALVDEVTRARMPAGAIPESDDDTPFIVEAIQWLRGAWGKYGKAIMGNPQAGAAMLKNQAAKLQQVQYAITHPDEYKTLYDRFVAESGAEPGKLDEFIHSLGYPTPAELMNQEATDQDDQD